MNMELYRNDDPVCPHCFKEVSIGDHEFWQLYEEETHEIDCPHCKKEFVVSSEATWKFTTAKEIEEL